MYTSYLILMLLILFFILNIDALDEIFLPKTIYYIVVHKQTDRQMNRRQTNIQKDKNPNPYNTSRPNNT